MPKDKRGIPGEIGPYQIQRRIAIGGMAEIYLARRSGPEGFSKNLVIKRIHSHLAGNPSFNRMFITEAKLAARLQHPNIAQVLDFGLFEESYYIVMEYVEGRDLRTLYRKFTRYGRLLPLPLSVYIARETAKALAYAHSIRFQNSDQTGVVHRDVSPQNILLSTAGEVKLTDFGIAQVTAHESTSDGNTLKGKIAYMSPEQSRGNEIDGRSDLFSLGIVMFESATGQRLFSGTNDIESLERVRSLPIPDVRSLEKNIPENYALIIHRCLHRDPDKRFQNARELTESLSRFISEQRYLSLSIELGDIVARLDGLRGPELEVWAHRFGCKPNPRRLKQIVQQKPLLRKPAVPDTESSTTMQDSPLTRQADAAAVPRKTSVRPDPDQNFQPRRQGPNAIFYLLPILLALLLAGIEFRFHPLMNMLNALFPGSGTILILTNAPEATLKLNGKKYGKLQGGRSLILSDMTAGNYTLEAEAASYSPAETQINLPRNGNRNVLLYLHAKSGLVIRCNRCGAHVRIDDKEVGTTSSPTLDNDFELAIPDLPPGSYRLQVEKDGYPPALRTLTTTAEVNIVQIQLLTDATENSLEIICNVPAASIFLDNQCIGSTNAAGIFAGPVAVGSHQLKITHPDHLAHESEIRILSDRNSSLTISLRQEVKPVRLRVICDIEGARVFLDNAFQGKIRNGSLTLNSVQPGRHHLKINADGFQAAEKAIRITPGHTNSIDFLLQSEAWIDITITSDPIGAGLYFDGEFAGLTPVTIQSVPGGDHSIRLERTGCEPVSRNLRVSAENRHFSIPLKTGG